MYHDAFRVSVILILWSLLSALSDAQQPQIQSDANVSYLKNKSICVGVDLNRGGAIAYLADAIHKKNFVNVHDLGRYIQQSYYSGPEPFGSSPHPKWGPWPWNPLCSGDIYEHVSRVLKHTNNRKVIYVKTLPKQWALNNVDSECFMEQWIELQDNAVLIRNRLTNHRSDKRLYPARTSEDPTIWAIRALNHIFTYTGAHPFENDRLTQITKVAEGAGYIPFDKWFATENWAAAVDDNNWGIGIFHPGAFEFMGGFFLSGTTGGPMDNPTTYMAPLRQELLDHDIVYDYNYVLLVGTLQQIRQYVYDHRPNVLPDYHFTNDRQHWWYWHATDTGMPIRGELNVNLESIDSAMFGPVSWWNADQVPTLYIEAAFHTKRNDARLYWRTPEKPDFSQKNSLRFTFNNDGAYHVYKVDLGKSPAYRGCITGIQLAPGWTNSPEEYLQVRYITHIKPSRRVTETDALLSTHPSVAATSGVPPGAVLILTFENDTLRRENNVLAEVADLSGKGLVGKVKGALVVAGKVGNGLELGNDRYLEIKGEFPSGKQSRTFAAWFKQTESEPRLQFALTQGAGDPERGFGIQAFGVWGVNQRGSPPVKTSVHLDNAWHHHCLIYDGEHVMYFIDARLAAKERKTWATSPGPLILGAGYSYMHNFRGVIDEVAVFDRALSVAEVHRIYEMGENGVHLSVPSASTR